MQPHSTQTAQEQGMGRTTAMAEMETLKHDRNPTGSKQKLPNHSPIARAYKARALLHLK